MTHTPAPAAAPDPSPEQLELARVLASPTFVGAQWHQRLLRHLVEEQLAGRVEMLKEMMLAIVVFQRPADRFDPRQDSIVRVEARRLSWSSAASTSCAWVMKRDIARH